MTNNKYWRGTILTSEKASENNVTSQLAMALKHNATIPSDPVERAAFEKRILGKHGS